MKKRSIVILIILLLVVRGENTSNHLQYKNIDKTVLTIAEENNITAIDIAYTKNNTIIYEKTTKEGLYCIGSISKSFITVLTLILEQEKQLSLEDTVKKHLPDLNINKDITIEDLLTMRSGIADYMTNFNIEDYYKEYDIYELINKGISHSFLLNHGEINYSNTNTLIAQLIIEKVTNKSCSELIKEKILTPLELNNTYFTKQGNTVRGYSNTVYEKHVDFTDTTTSWAGYACGMYSTAKDMAKWGAYLSTLEDKKLLSYSDTNDYTILYGNVPGYSAALYIKNDIVLAVLCNLSDYSGLNQHYADRVARAILL